MPAVCQKQHGPVTMPLCCGWWGLPKLKLTQTRSSLARVQLCGTALGQAPTSQRKSSQHASGTGQQASYLTKRPNHRKFSFKKKQNKNRMEKLRVGMKFSCHRSWTIQDLPRRRMSRSKAPSLLNLSFIRLTSHSLSVIDTFILLRCFTEFSWIRG